MNSTVKVNFYIDGNYTYHIYDSLLTEKHSKIDWRNLKDYVCDFISSKENATKSVISNCHYFIGSGERINQGLYNFERELDNANIQKKSFKLKAKYGGKGLKEDAIDTSLVWTATKDFFKNPVDYVVLLAGDSDFVPLLDGLKTEGAKTIVVYFDIPARKKKTETKAAQALIEMADYVIDLQAVFSDRKDKRAQDVFQDITIVRVGRLAEKQKVVGNVCNILPEKACAFIETDGKSYYFSSTNLRNCSFDNLKEGDLVTYKIKKRFNPIAAERKERTGIAFDVELA